jgi:hypothetical protein
MLCVRGMTFQWGLAAIEDANWATCAIAPSRLAIRFRDRCSEAVFDVAAEDGLSTDGRLSFYPNGTKPTGQLLV